ncbi:YCII-like protein [Penicillium sp. IBT 18751x]|nr:YCII-like protein [Penicillium sp. IBT 18751x]
MPDNPNTLELRKQVKGQVFCAIFTEHPQEGKDAQFQGSVVVYTGESAEEVRNIIMDDIYARSGVWDIERIDIMPVRGLPW